MNTGSEALEKVKIDPTEQYKIGNQIGNGKHLKVYKIMDTYRNQQYLVCKSGKIHAI